MSCLQQLDILDLSPQIEQLPLKPGHQVLPERGAESYITFHYSAVVYRDRSEAAELKRILDEAKYQIGKSWAPRNWEPIYGNGLMYDFVVLSSGRIVRTRRRRQRLWHCGNSVGNSKSWSIHVMLGGDQDLMPAQRDSLYRLFDALRADGNILRSSVVAHCEWPRQEGLPVLTTRYDPQPRQSACPGPVLIEHVYAYRALPDTRRYRVIAQPAYVREYRDRLAPVALHGTALLTPDTVVEVDDVTDGWAHLSNQWGFVALKDLEAL